MRTLGEGKGVLKRRRAVSGDFAWGGVLSSVGRSRRRKCAHSREGCFEDALTNSQIRVRPPSITTALRMSARRGWERGYSRLGKQVRLSCASVVSAEGATRREGRGGDLAESTCRVDLEGRYEGEGGILSRRDRSGEAGRRSGVSRGKCARRGGGCFEGEGGALSVEGVLRAGRGRHFLRGKALGRAREEVLANEPAEILRALSKSPSPSTFARLSTPGKGAPSLIP